MTTKARGTGDGAIYQRGGKGRWFGVVTVGYSPRVRKAKDGAAPQSSATRKRRTVSGATRAEVERQLQAVRRGIATGAPQLDGRTTVALYLESWLERVEGRVRPTTMASYRSICDHQLTPHLGAIKLARLAPDNVDAMLAQLQRGGGKLSPRTASHARAVLRTALSDAMKRELVVRNSAALADPPRVPSPSPNVPTVESIHEILAAVSGSDVEAVVTVGLFSGLRLGEILGLRWSDVSFETRQIAVSRSLQRLGRLPARLVEVKSMTSHRAVPLLSPALAALQSERKRQAERQLAAGSRWKPTIQGLVFTDALGQPLVGTTVTKAFQRKLREAGLASLRFHDLRHAYAGRMLASGEELAVVSHLLGHSSLNLTLNTYAGVAPELKRAAAERFERLLSRPG